ncbi:hypothetical protein OJAV_G00078750 [Oryzias javanicus]|uniref:adenylate cyclase n=1 Tax=Oryzias javanicus TaxID=123683 RepID=A0A3S2PBP0_ORYJA|nr:hypothetical protein OJAV_G00078750 [Oryzias javanicus]
MASPQHQQLLPHNTEVSCDSSGDGGVSVKIGSSGKHKHGIGPLGSIGGGFIGGAKHCKYSISSSCSSGESGMKRPVVKSFRAQRKMPQLFERSAGHFWDPKFDSSILEEACTFSLCIEVLLLLYSVLHVRLYASVLLGLLYSVVFESLGWMHLSQVDGDQSSEWATLRWLGPAKALLHLCAHAIGMHLFIMSEVRSRSTFLKVGQAIMHGKDLEVEKALKERMIHSVMPRIVADELMKQSDEDIGDNSAKRYSTSGAAAVISSPKSNKRKKTSIPRGQIIFRPFNMKRMEPVSILFADIVGFTKMSANKSAHALVGLLNDLFGRFDRLCEITGCEKISTLGDCYYCVAGCPEPRPNHAYCCVEMGLGMIQAIEQFCQEKREMVNMRVGVHTGTVLCGILGMKRFKFDVWSNDVNLANLMEQLGVAGKVHLSQATAKFLDDRYRCEDGQVVERIGPSVVADQLKGQRTFLISGRRDDLHSHCSCSQMGLSVPEDHQCPKPSALTPDGAPPACALPADKTKLPCLPCSVALIAGEDQVLELVHNGCHDDHKPNNSEDSSNLKCSPAASFGRSPKAVNGLLSPQLEALNNSQTSLCEMLQEKEKKTWSGAGMGMDHSALIPLRSKNFRERSDAHFVDVIKEDSLMKDYFYKPPLNKLSLTFLERSLESAYRISYQEEVENQAAVRTFASPTFSSFLDMLLCCLVFLALSLACFLRALVDPQNNTLSTPALILTAAAALLEALALLFAIRMAFYLDGVLSCTRGLMTAISGWMARHFIGSVLVSLPAVAVFSHVTCDVNFPTEFICCAIIIAIIQYCNFCQLCYWMRSTIATLVGLAMVTLLFSSPCSLAVNLFSWSNARNNSDNSSALFSDFRPIPNHDLAPEVCVAFFLLLVLVLFLNREFEVSYRLHYHGNVEADQHRIKIQNMRDQADWLLRNIIPIHVAEQLKVTQSYSKNHDNVGVIFASIVNFSEFYEESYEGGKECYRVLNELIGDFDELLRKPAFTNIEKIKTIGATYMAASGLNTQQCADAAHPHAHLRALFEFALEMMRVVDDFNKNMLGFGFKLRIGFNHGPLTAGVIGTTKLLYDIWGDTVNIASRMDTTGVECRVQVSEESYCVLSGMDYEFDYRGTVNVKGKGQMKTFLYPKSSDSGPVPQYQLSVSPEIRAQVDGSIGRSPTDEIASMVPTTSTSARSTNPLVLSASTGSSNTRGLNNLKEADIYGSRPSPEAPCTRRSMSHSGLTSIPANNSKGSSSNISSQTQHETFQNSTRSLKDNKSDEHSKEEDSDAGELTRL